jgi:hypothetical protein
LAGRGPPEYIFKWLYLLFFKRVIVYWSKTISQTDCLAKRFNDGGGHSMKVFPKTLLVLLLVLFLAVLSLIPLACGKKTSPSSPAGGGGNNNSGGGLATSVACPLTAPSSSFQIGTTGTGLSVTVAGVFAAGGLGYGNDLAIDPANGYLYVYDFGKGPLSCLDNRVQQFNLSGAYQRQFYPSGNSSGSLDYGTCAGMAADSAGNFYYAYNNIGNDGGCGVTLTTSEIIKFNSSGVSIGAFNDSTNSDGAMRQIYCMTIDSQNNLYVVAGGNSNVLIRKLTTAGADLASASSNGYLVYANALSTDSNNNLYVLDGEGQSVAIYSPSLQALGGWGSPGSGQGQFYTPMGMAVGPGNLVYVVDDTSTYGRIEVFKTDGTFCDELDLASNVFTWDVKTDAAGNIYVEEAIPGYEYPVKFSPGAPGGPTATATSTPTNTFTPAIPYTPTNTPTATITATPTFTPTVTPTPMPWTAETLPSSQNWTSVAYGNGIFVAVAAGPSTVAATSPDGINWTAQTLPSSQAWESVTYGNGIFVAVASGSGLSGTVAEATSPDGVTWTAHNLPALQNWKSVAYGNGVFVAVGALASGIGSPVGATSPDGITWTSRTLPSSSGWTSVAYGNGIFVAITPDNTVAATSPDGITWTTRTLPSSKAWYAVTYGNGEFVVVADGGAAVAATSPDGINWTAQTLPSTQSWDSVTYGNGVFVAVIYGGAVAATSPDGVAWTTQNLPSSQYWSSVAYGNGLLVAVAGSSAVAAISP